MSDYQEEEEEGYGYIPPGYHPYVNYQPPQLLIDGSPPSVQQSAPESQPQQLVADQQAAQYAAAEPQQQTRLSPEIPQQQYNAPVVVASPTSAAFQPIVTVSVSVSMPPSLMSSPIQQQYIQQYPEYSQSSTTYQEQRRPIASIQPLSSSGIEARNELLANTGMPTQQAQQMGILPPLSSIEPYSQQPAQQRGTAEENAALLMEHLGGALMSHGIEAKKGPIAKQQPVSPTSSAGGSPASQQSAPSAQALQQHIEARSATKQKAAQGEPRSLKTESALKQTAFTASAGAPSLSQPLSQQSKPSGRLEQLSVKKRSEEKQTSLAASVGDAPLPQRLAPSTKPDQQYYDAKSKKKHTASAAAKGGAQLSQLSKSKPSGRLEQLTMVNRPAKKQTRSTVSTSAAPSAQNPAPSVQADLQHYGTKPKKKQTDSAAAKGGAQSSSQRQMKSDKTSASSQQARQQRTDASQQARQQRADASAEAKQPVTGSAETSSTASHVWVDGKPPPFFKFEEPEPRTLTFWEQLAASERNPGYHPYGHFKRIDSEASQGDE